MKQLETWYLSDTDYNAVVEFQGLNDTLGKKLSVVNWRNLYGAMPPLSSVASSSNRLHQYRNDAFSVVITAQKERTEKARTEFERQNDVLNEMLKAFDEVQGS